MSRCSEKPVMRRVIDHNRVNLPSQWVNGWHLETGDYVQIIRSAEGKELTIKPVKNL